MRAYYMHATQLSVNGTGKKKEDAAPQKKPLSAGGSAGMATATSHDDLEVEDTAQRLLKARGVSCKSVGGSGGSTIVKADFNKDELFFHGQQLQQQGAYSDPNNHHLSTRTTGTAAAAAGVGSDENAAITLSKVNKLSIHRRTIHSYPLVTLTCYTMLYYLSVCLVQAAATTFGLPKLGNTK